MTLSVKHKIFKGCINGVQKLLKFFLGEGYLKFSAALFNELDLTYEVAVDNKKIKFWCLSETVRIRAREMLKREPDTLEWINTFAEDEVLLDVGSNTGVFSLYAAKNNGNRVIAIDPLPQNYYSIFENITKNKLNSLIIPMCLAISDQTKLDELFINSKSYTPGGAGSSFGSQLDNYGSLIQSYVSCWSLGFSLDDLLRLFELPFPNHIKVDIDGIQEKVVLGAKSTLRDSRLKSVMIELQPNSTPLGGESNKIILSEMEAAGFSCLKVVGSTPNITGDRNIYPTNNFFYRELDQK